MCKTIDKNNSRIFLKPINGEKKFCFLLAYLFVHYITFLPMVNSFGDWLIHLFHLKEIYISDWETGSITHKNNIALL